VVTGTFFNGHLRVEFGSEHDGWIPMRLALHGDTVATTPCGDNFEEGEPEVCVKNDVQVHMHFASVWCAFGDLIRWLEAIVIGVQECAFAWDAEGPDGELRWHGGHRESGLLTVKWCGKEIAEYQIRLNTVQMVGEFYRKFRSFVESENYEPLRYERLTVAEVTELVLKDCTLDELASEIASRGRSDARCLVDAVLDIAYSHSVNQNRWKSEHPRHVSLAYCIRFAAQRQDKGKLEEEPAEDRWCPRDWDEWGIERRKTHMRDFIFCCECGFSYGGKLRQLRSALVENWLEADETQAPSVG